MASEDQLSYSSIAASCMMCDWFPESLDFDLAYTYNDQTMRMVRRSNIPIGPWGVITDCTD